MRASFRMLVLSALTFTGAAHAAPAEEDDVIRMSRGTQKILSLPHLKRAQVGDRKVLTTKQLGPNELLIEAERPGKTTLTVWTGKDKKESWAIEVTAEKLPLVETPQ